jgi:hypothetical protein
MKRALFLLNFLGLLGLASAVSGISSYSVTTHGASVAYHPWLLPRAVAAVWGVFLVLLAFGIHRRSMAAYWGGWVLLASSCAWFLYAALPVILASESLLRPLGFSWRQLPPLSWVPHLFLLTGAVGGAVNWVTSGAALANNSFKADGFAAA